MFKTTTVNVMMLAFHDEVNRVRPIEITHCENPNIDTILDGIYYLGQNENCDDPRIRSTTCSVSVGDVIPWDGKFYMVASMGFREISEDQLEKYKASTRDERFFLKYELGE